MTLSPANAEPALPPTDDAEHAYRTLFMTGPQPMWVVDSETFAFLAVNDAAVSHYGYSRAEFLSMRIFDVRVPEDVASATAALRVAARAGECVQSTSRHVRRDGSVIDMEIMSRALTFGGRPARAAVATDVTERLRDDAVRRTRTARMAAVVAMQQEIATSTPALDPLLARVARQAQQLTGADGAVVELLEGDAMVYRAACGLAAGGVGLRLTAATSLSGLCVAAGEPLSCDDTELDPRVDRAACRRIGARSMVVVPLFVAARCAGVLKVLASEPARFTPDDVQVLGLQAGLLGAAIDRAEALEALAASEDRFRNAFQHAGIGMAVVGLDGAWLQVNPALCALTGYSEAELRGLTFQQITHPDDLELDLGLAGRLVAGEMESYQIEKRYVCKDGEPVWILLTASCIRDRNGRALQFVAQVQDISARKALEAELRQQAAALARSNTELAEFASVASHDLQEPLRKIEAFGDRLATGYAASLPPEAGEYLARMQRAAGRMRTLVDDLLTLSRVATKGAAFAPVDLAAVAREVLDDLEEAITQSGARVDVGPLPTVAADALQMRQLLQNLIGNALKFRRPGVAPVVAVDVCAREPDAPEGQIRLQVTDNGIGFEQKHAERIFGAFQRLHGRSEYDGTGMGLAICRKISERHGGTITAHGDSGAGATFVVTLGAPGRRSTLGARGMRAVA